MLPPLAAHPAAAPMATVHHGAVLRRSGTAGRLGSDADGGCEQVLHILPSMTDESRQGVQSSLLPFPGKATANPFSDNQATLVSRSSLYGSEPHEWCCSRARSWPDSRDEGALGSAFAQVAGTHPRRQVESGSSCGVVSRMRMPTVPPATNPAGWPVWPGSRRVCPGRQAAEKRHRKADAGQERGTDQMQQGNFRGSRTNCHADAQRAGHHRQSVERPARGAQKHSWSATPTWRTAAWRPPGV
jgi:hypothetical protein